MIVMRIEPSRGICEMVPTIASGMTVGLLGAAIMWIGGHNPVLVGVAYSLTGMLGMLGSAVLVSASRRSRRATYR
jgi:hypothetical protein